MRGGGQAGRGVPELLAQVVAAHRVEGAPLGQLDLEVDGGRAGDGAADVELGGGGGVGGAPGRQQ